MKKAPDSFSKINNCIFIILAGAYLFVMAVFCILKPADKISDSERRKLAQFPAISAERIINGNFASDFEAYTMDQFPFRDNFRSLKAFTAYYPLRQLDQNGIYRKDGYVSAYVYPENEQMLDYAADRFQDIYDRYLKDTDTKVYFAVIPDKNCYLESLHPSMDYDKFIQDMEKRVSYMQPISLMDVIHLQDFYYTDTHLRQDRLLNVSEKLATEMGVPFEVNYELKTLEKPFYGVYYSQSSLCLEPDTIHYLTNPNLENCIVTGYDTGKATALAMYDFEKAAGKDAYDFFLSGPQALMTIENPNAASTKELVLFRDSYGSSIAPLLAGSYRKITLVDTRYMSPAMLDNFIEFEQQDVLFLYSSLLLNNSMALKK